MDNPIRVLSYRFGFHCRCVIFEGKFITILDFTGLRFPRFYWMPLAPYKWAYTKIYLFWLKSTE